MRSCQTTWDVFFEFVQKSDPILLSLMQNFKDTCCPDSSSLVISDDLCALVQRYYEEQVLQERFPEFLRDRLAAFLNGNLKQNFSSEASSAEAKSQFLAPGEVDSQVPLAQGVDQDSPIKMPQSHNKGGEFFSRRNGIMRDSLGAASGRDGGLGDSRSSIASDDGDLFEVYGDQLDDLFSRNPEGDADEVTTDAFSSSPLGRLGALFDSPERKQQSSAQASDSPPPGTPEVDSVFSNERCSIPAKSDTTALDEPPFNEGSLLAAQGGECKIQVLHADYCDSMELVSLMASKTTAGQALQLFTCSDDVWDLAAKRLGPGGVLIYTASAGPNNISRLKQYLAVSNPQGGIFEKNVFTHLREDDLDEGIKQLLLNGIEGIPKNDGADFVSIGFDDNHNVIAQHPLRFTSLSSISKDTQNPHCGLEGSMNALDLTEANGGSVSLSSGAPPSVQSSSKRNQAESLFLPRADSLFDSIDSPLSSSELSRYACRPNLFGSS